MYCNQLGRFDVPTGENGLLQVTYTPEPVPVFTKSAMNPWEVARAQELRLKEDAAWKEIQRLTALIRTIEANIASAVRHYNQTLHTLEGHLDNEVAPDLNIALPIPGFSPITSKADLVMKIIFPPFMLPGFDIIGKMIGGFFGIGKKAKPVPEFVAYLVGMMKTDQAKIEAGQNQLIEAVGQLQQAVGLGNAVKQEIATKQTANMQANEAAYKDRRFLDNQRAAVLRERIRQVATLPRSPGGSNDL